MADQNTQKDLLELEKKLLSKQEELEEKQEEVEEEKDKLEDLRKEYKQKLEKISSLTTDEARQKLHDAQQRNL